MRHLARRLDLEIVGSGNYAIAAFPFWTLHSLTLDLLGDKLVVAKMKRRKNYRRTKGHRQEQTVLKILEVSPTGTKPKGAAKKAAPKKDEAEAKDAPKKKAPAKKAAPKKEAKAEEAPAKEAKAAAKKPAAKKKAPAKKKTEE